MSFDVVSDQELDALLKAPQPAPVVKRKNTALIPQYDHVGEGPITQLDEIVGCEFDLASRRCVNGTYYAINGKPGCLMHIIREANRLLHERGEK